jgi:hypothetical protein
MRYPKTIAKTALIIATYREGIGLNINENPLRINGIFM